jgi:hypothetical protein
MHKQIRTMLATVALAAASCVAAENPFIGNFALTIPNGGAGWLGISEKDSQLKGSLLWGGGSPVDCKSVKVEGDTLIVTREFTNKRKGPGGKETSEKEIETIRAKLAGDAINLTTERQKVGSDKVTGKTEFSGKRIPAPGPAPDLAKVKFGEPISLFNGKDLTGWRLINEKATNGWLVEKGVLINRVEKKPGVHYGNIRTDREFEDFNLTLEARPTAGSNSGVYLRGIYEIQILESFGKPVDCHNMGALYGRIVPACSAEKPAGEWQTLDITLVNRHVTVVLNGKKILDNQPIVGCTGGALTSDEFKPGPIYLQGDHTNIEFRNMVLRPVVK